MMIKTKKKKKEEQPQKHWEQPRKDFTFLEWIKEDVQKNFRENTLVVSFKQWEIENPFFFQIGTSVRTGSKCQQC